MFNVGDLIRLTRDLPWECTYGRDDGRKTPNYWVVVNKLQSRTYEIANKDGRQYYRHVNVMTDVTDHERALWMAGNEV